MPVLIFPEGTRSPDGQLLPFKDGAFRLAIETGAHVLPIAVSGTEHALRKGDWRPSPARGLIRVGAPIPTAGLSLTDAAALKQSTVAAIESLVRSLDH